MWPEVYYFLALDHLRTPETNDRSGVAVSRLDSVDSWLRLGECVALRVSDHMSVLDAVSQSLGLFSIVDL